MVCSSLPTATSKTGGRQRKRKRCSSPDPGAWRSREATGSCWWGALRECEMVAEHQSRHVRIRSASHCCCHRSRSGCCQLRGQRRRANDLFTTSNLTDGILHASLTFMLTHVKLFSRSYSALDLYNCQYIEHGVYAAMSEHVDTILDSLLQGDSFLAFQRHEPCSR